MFRTGLMRRPTSNVPVNRDVFRDPFADFFDRFFESDLWGPLGTDEATRTWRPAVDFRQTEDAYLVDVELPGLTKKDVHISIEDNVLTVSGERKIEHDEKKENYERVERAYGRFSRSFTLPGSVDSDKVKASFKDGVLNITLPKTEHAKARQIEIQ